MKTVLITVNETGKLYASPRKKKKRYQDYSVYNVLWLSL